MLAPCARCARDAARCPPGVPHARGVPCGSVRCEGEGALWLMRVAGGSFLSLCSLARVLLTRKPVLRPVPPRWTILLLPGFHRNVQHSTATPATYALHIQASGGAARKAATVEPARIIPLLRTASSCMASFPLCSSTDVQPPSTVLLSPFSSFPQADFASIIR